MPATVGKYALKGIDQAADWVKNIKFGKNADIATENDRVLVMDLDGLQRQLSYSRRGQEQLLEPGGITGGSTDAIKSRKYADFVEFAESTDQPIHMPVVRVNDEGDLYLEDGSVTLAAMRDAGLTEIPVMVNKADTRDIPGHMLSLEGMTTVFNKDVPVTKAANYKPKTLTHQQQKEFNAQVDAGRPAHTAKSIVLGEMPMDQASREARRIEQGIKNRGYHRGSPDIKNIEPGQDGFFMSEDPLVSATYPGRGGPTATYELRYDDSNMLNMNAFGRKWNQLGEERNLDDVIVNDFPVYTPDGQELKLHSEMGSGVPYTGTDVEDTNDLAMLARGMNAEGVVIDNVHDLGGNFQGAKNVFGEMNKNLLPSHKNIFDARWADFLQDYDREGGTNIVSATGRGIRSAIGAAYDARNKALPNILGGGAALAVGLGASDESAAAEKPRITPEFATRMFDRIVADNPGREKNAYIPVKPTTMDYVQNAGRAIIDYFGTDPGKDMLGGLGQEVAVESTLGGLGQMIFGPVGAVGGAALMPNVAGDPMIDMLNDQGQPMTEAEFAAYRRQLRGN